MRVAASAGRGGAQRRDWTQGSIVGNLWALAWPSLITSTLNVAGPAVDMIWIGKLGSGAIFDSPTLSLYNSGKASDKDKENMSFTMRFYSDFV